MSKSKKLLLILLLIFYPSLARADVLFPDSLILIPFSIILFLPGLFGIYFFVKIIEKKIKLNKFKKLYLLLWVLLIIISFFSFKHLQNNRFGDDKLEIIYYIHYCAYIVFGIILLYLIIKTKMKIKDIIIGFFNNNFTKAALLLIVIVIVMNIKGGYFDMIFFEKDMCEKIVSDLIRYECVMMNFENFEKYDSSICNTFKSGGIPDYREDCMFEYSKDPIIDAACSVDPLYYDCYYYIEDQKNKITVSSCQNFERIENSGEWGIGYILDSDTCYFYLALKQSDYTLCGEIKWRPSRQECLSEIEVNINK